MGALFNSVFLIGKNRAHCTRGIIYYLHSGNFFKWLPLLLVCRGLGFLGLITVEDGLGLFVIGYFCQNQFPFNYFSCLVMMEDGPFTVF